LDSRPRRELYESSAAVINADWHLAASDGLMMSDKAAVVGMSRVNPFPTTNIHRKRLHADREAAEVVRPDGSEGGRDRAEQADLQVEAAPTPAAARLTGGSVVHVVQVDPDVGE
jgi:hypothetical protein